MSIKVYFGNLIPKLPIIFVERRFAAKPNHLLWVHELAAN